MSATPDSRDPAHTSMSRAAYLAKYLADEPKKKLKKRKSNEIPDSDSQHSSQVLIGTLFQLPEAPEEVSLDRGDEFSPQQVEAPTSSQANLGFKRIDNGEVVDQEKAPSVGETVYRDRSGRIIDIEEKKRQIQEEKAKKEMNERQVKDRINTGELNKVQQRKEQEELAQAKTHDVSKTDEEYNRHMKQKAVFDDPLLAFQEKTNSVQTSTETGRAIYTGGMHPSNRFKIPAGYFWDGIDRSNGFEERLLKKRAESRMEKLAKKHEVAYTEYDYE